MQHTDSADGDQQRTIGRISSPSAGGPAEPSPMVIRTCFSG